jgi:hypothetical protein
MLLAHVDDLRAEDVDVDVGGGQHHVLELFREAAVADRHLAQRFQRQPVPHRMREDRDLFHLGIASPDIGRASSRALRE